MTMRLRLRTIFPAALAVAAVLPLRSAAQPEDLPAETSRPGWSVDRTMREFLRSLPGEPVGYFPSRGEWAWVASMRYPNGTPRRNIRRFPAAQTERAISPGGPVCHMFHTGDVAVLGTVVYPGDRDNGGWRRVGAARFVPPGAPPSSPVFVEWRREDGRWVVAAIGQDARYREPRPPGTDPHEAVRGPRGVPLRLPLPDSARVATEMEWYRNNLPIMVGGYRIIRYQTLRLKESDVVRWGSLDGVGLYVEAGSDPRRPEVVYVPVDREGSFEAYQNMTGAGCEAPLPSADGDEG